MCKSLYKMRIEIIPKNGIIILSIRDTPRGINKRKQGERKMRIAAKGKYFIEATDKKRNRKFFPFYDGFDTKKEAEEFCEKMNKATPNFAHTVVKR